MKKVEASKVSFNANKRSIHSDKLNLGVLLLAATWMVAGAAYGQTTVTMQVPVPTTASATTAPAAASSAVGNLTFDVASVRPSATVDMMKVAADMQAGKMPKWGAHINGLRAEYNYQRLKDLIVAAYKVKDYQVTAPDWMNKTDAQRFDIAARMPGGSNKDDAATMLQALLAERFKLKIHRETQEHPVMALVVGKNGPKMKESPGDAPPIDPDVPLKSGEMQVDTADGPARMTMDKNGMGGTMNMGTKGIITYSVDMKTMTMHMTSSKSTMTALADLLSQLMMQMGGATGGGRPVLDKTDLKGNYEISMDFSLADMIAQASAQAGFGEGGATNNAAGPEASDPGGSGVSVSDSLSKMGLKLDSRKAPIEQLVVDSSEKMPTEN